MPVRWRLTLWYVALLGLVLVLFGVVLFFGLRERLYAGFDEQLGAQAAVTRATVQIVGNTPTLNTTHGGDQEGEYFLRLLDGRGKVLFDNGDALGGVPLSPDAIDAALAGQTRLSSLAVGDGETLRVLTTPLRRDGETGPVVGVFQMGLDRHEIDVLLDQLLATLTMAAPLALAAAAWVGYVVAGRALAPVGKISRLASVIGGQDLRARLNLDLPNDELGQLGRAFDRMLDRIEDGFERQRRFTGDAAHELRTPLSLLQTRFDLALARPRTNKEYRLALQEAQTDLARLTGLVNTLLTLARVDSGQIPLGRSRFDLAGTVAAVREQYGAKAAEAGVTLDSDTVPTPLVADEDLLRQILVNLMENALKHTPPGGRVIVGCRPDGPCARFWVADSGIGIPAEHQAQVFDRFYRVDAGRSRAAGGTGLGLAICRAIGGAIWLMSRPGDGTRVEVSLPTRSVSAQDADRCQAATSRS
jgi:heavy metal sensor kinase